MRFSVWFRSAPLDVHQVAERLGVHRQTVDRYIRGQLMPRPEMIGRIRKLTKGKVTAADLAASCAAERSR